MLIFNLVNHTPSEHLEFRMAAIVNHQIADREHVRWADEPAAIGDQFVINVVESDGCDSPQQTLLEKATKPK